MLKYMTIDSTNLFYTVYVLYKRRVMINNNLYLLREMIKSDLSQQVLFYPIQNFKYQYTPLYPQPASNLTGWVGILIIGMLFMTIGEMIAFPFSNAFAMERAKKGNRRKIGYCIGTRVKNKNKLRTKK